MVDKAVFGDVLAGDEVAGEVVALAVEGGGEEGEGLPAVKGESAFEGEALEVLEVGVALQFVQHADGLG